MTFAEDMETSQRLPDSLLPAAMEVMVVFKDVKRAYDAAPDEDRAIIDSKSGGPHAYRYEVLDDGSVVALWTTTIGQYTIKAFSDMSAASQWSPRNER